MLPNGHACGRRWDPITGGRVCPELGQALTGTCHFRVRRVDEGPPLPGDVGVVTGAGEAAALGLRLVSGPLADRTRRFWGLTIAGYAGTYDEQALEQHLDSRGFMNRILGRLTKSITHPGQMYPLGLLFGVGFDTATEVTLMVMAGSGAAAGLPWYAVLCLPLLFAAGMSLFDTLDGTFMNFAYQWSFSNPVRKVFYNLTITGLSIAVAFLIGTIELVGVLHEKPDLTDAVTGWIAGLDLDNVGCLIGVLFVVVWAAAVGYWQLAKVEQRWVTRLAEGG
ncbi:hypothetical protein [Streptomyces sp. NPDC058457]|uniref:HoxN/HupN/NixA family nickel/cobalt transporter n=1 Tax=Streptomyces sp. NPDC058457 TaxID=3346507 RepID=UPI00365F6915